MNRRQVFLSLVCAVAVLALASQVLAGKPAPPTPIVATTTDQNFLDNVQNQVSSQTVFNLTIDVSGTGTHYRYKVGPSATTNPNDFSNYSYRITEPTPLLFDISDQPDGEFVLCLQGCQEIKDKWGMIKSIVYQQGATTYYWFKLTSTPNVAPTFTWVEPDGANDAISAGTPFTLKWADEDPDDDAMIDFYYGDTFAETHIPGFVFEDADGAGNDELVWDTTGVADGIYFLCACVTDSEGTRTTCFWSPFPVVIGSPPAAPWNWQPEQIVTGVGAVSAAIYQVAMDGLGGAMAVGSCQYPDGLYAWSYSVYNGDTWSASADVAAASSKGFWTVPVLKSDGNGKYLFVYTEEASGGWDSDVIAIFFNGTTWEPAGQLIDELYDVDDNWSGGLGLTNSEFNYDAAYSADGTAMVVYREAATGTICTRRYDGLQWENEVSHNSGILPTIASDDYGNFMIAYAHGNTNGPDEGQLYYMHFDGGQWSDEYPLNEHGNMIWGGGYWVGDSNPVKLMGTGYNKFVAVYTSQTENIDVKATLDRPSNIYGRFFNGAQWEPEAVLDNQSGTIGDNGDVAFRLAMSADETALVVWTQDNGTSLAVYGSRFDGSTWSSLPTKLSCNTYGDAKTHFGGLTIDAQGNGVVTFYDKPYPYYSVMKTHYVVGSGWQLQAVDDPTNRPTDREMLTDGTVADFGKSKVAGQADGKAIILFSPYDNDPPITSFSALEYGD